MNVVVDVALADGPQGCCALPDFVAAGILFRLRMWMTTTQMMSWGRFDESVSAVINGQNFIRA
jgi:hypothetical protein